MPVSPLLEQILRNVARRYRLPALDEAPARLHDGHPAAVIALSIEQARRDHERGQAPDAALKQIEGIVLSTPGVRAAPAPPEPARWL